MTNADFRKGDIVIGAMLILTGAAIMLDRADVFPWRGQWTLWPLILGGVGLARFVQSGPGEPKQGLLLLTAAVWLFLGEAGWVALEESWPIVIIVLGLIVALNSGTLWGGRGPDHPGAGRSEVGRTRRHHRSPSALAVIGIWIAVFAALQVSGIRSFSTGSGDDHVRVVSVMGRSEHTSPATAFQSADVTNVMGRSELDLRDATMAPGTSATVHVFSTMGVVVIRVPRTWIVDTGAVSALGGVRDERARPREGEVTAGPPPRLVLRGLVVMGRLTIIS
jgi:hypothetical protein